MTDMAHGTARRGATGWRILVWGGAALLLAAPLVAMQFTSEVNWTARDFLTFAAMLAAAAGAFELALRRGGRFTYRAAAAVAVGAAFVLVWANLAVGFIGDEGNPLNLMYAGVIAVALAGAILTRLRPRGMAPAMAATAAAQAGAAAVAQVAGYSVWWPTAVFVALWLLSAWLFWWAGRAI